MIHKKLLDFQKLGITLKKDGSNPHFKSSYVTLNEVLEKVKEPLNKLGIYVLQTPEETGLRTRLIDTESYDDPRISNVKEAFPDVGFVESFVPYVGTVDMQKLGGAITYARRYSLISMLGMEDEDDDGEAASKKPVAKGGVTEQTDEPFADKEFTI